MKGDKAICAYAPCSKEFIQKRGNQKYCCTACKQKSDLKKLTAWNKEHRNKEHINYEFNPYPITNATVLMTIRAHEKGEAIADIEKETKRRPGQLQEVITALKESGKYDKIAVYLEGTGLGNKGRYRMPVLPGTRKMN